MPNKKIIKKERKKRPSEVTTEWTDVVIPNYPENWGFVKKQAINLCNECIDKKKQTKYFIIKYREERRKGRKVLVERKGMEGRMIDRGWQLRRVQLIPL